MTRRRSECRKHRRLAARPLHRKGVVSMSFSYPRVTMAAAAVACALLAVAGCGSSG
jgi:hypothetical protein